MSDRLTPLDVSFLYLEEATTAMHVGGVVLFEVARGRLRLRPPGPADQRRIAFVPRYRQRIRWVPGQLANPVWVDDEDFDVELPRAPLGAAAPGHRRAAARPGRPASWRRPLDRNRPLWEMYLVEGLYGGRFAILTKTHHAMVDGVGGHRHRPGHPRRHPEPRDPPADEWRPSHEPSDVELLAGAVGDGRAARRGRRGRRRAGAVDVRGRGRRCGRRRRSAWPARVTRPAPGVTAQRRSARRAGSAWRR